MAESDPQNFDQKLGLDTSGLVEGVKIAVDALRQLEEQQFAVARSAQEAGDLMSKTTVTLTGTAAGTAKLTSTFRDLGGENESLNRNITLNIDKLLAQTAAMQALQGTSERTIKFLSTFSDKVNTAIRESQELKALTPESIFGANTVFGQAASASQLAAEQELLRFKVVAGGEWNRQEQESNALLAEQNRLAAIFKQHEAETLAIERSKTDAFKRQLDAQQATTGADLQKQVARGAGQNIFAGLGASVNENNIGRVSNSINQIVRQIEQGNIAASRANEIVNSVLQGDVSLFTDVEAKVANAARSINTATTEIKKNVADTGYEFEEYGNKAVRANNGVLLSWQSLTRLFQIQVLHTLLRAFIQSLSESIQTTIDFETRISEIRTISQDNQLSFEGWSKAVRDLSDEFGRPAAEVAEGVYETLSNQIAKGTEATTFMTQALEFARTTHSTTAQSVNLLSSAINSFGLSVGDTEKIAASFFKTIDLGRLRAEDIANTYGRVGPIAHALGLSMDEVNAVLATLTIRGVPANEAIVLLNNVLTHLAKPTKDMKDLFDQLGVSTGEQAIQVFGFTGVLQKLDEATHGNTAAQEELLRDIRAVRGEIGLSGQGLEDYKKNLDSIANAQQNYNRAIGIAGESPAIELQKQLTQVKNFISSDFAEPFIKGVVDISKALSDDGLLGIFKTLVAVVKDGSIAFLSYLAVSKVVEKTTLSNIIAVEAEAGALTRSTDVHLFKKTILEQEILAAAELQRAEMALIVADNEEAFAAREAAAAHELNINSLRTQIATEEGLIASSTLLGRALSTVAGILTNPVFIGTAILTGIAYVINRQMELTRQVEEAYQKASDAAKKSLQEITASVDKETAKQVEAWDKAFSAEFKGFTEFAGSLNSKLKQLVEDQKAYLTDLVAVTKRAIDDFVNDFNQKTRELEDAKNRSNENIRNAQRDLRREQADADQAAFNRAMQLAQHLDAMATPGKGIKLFDEHQLDLVFNRLQDLQNAAQKLYTSFNDPKNAQQNLADAQKNLKEQESLINDLRTRRLSIEQQRKQVAEQIQAIESRSDIQNIENALREKVREDRTSPRSTSRDPNAAQQANRQRGLQIQQDEASLAKEREQAEAKRIATELQNLRLREQAFDKSLASIPQINALEQDSLDIHQKNNELLQKFIDLEKQAAKAAEDAAKQRKLDFENLRATLTQLSSFKVDKPEIKTQADLDKQIAAYDKLTDAAVKYGLHDQNVLDKIIEQRIAMEQKGQTEILRIRAETEERSLEAARKASEQKFKEDKERAAKAQKDLIDVLPKIHGVLGEFSASSLPGGVVGYSPRGQIEDILRDVENALKNKAPVTSGTVDRLDAAIREFYNQYNAGRQEWVIKKGTDTTPTITVRDEIDRLEKAAIQFRQFIDAQAKARGAVSQDQAAAQALQTQLDQFRASQNLNDTTKSTTKTFSDLIREIQNTITSLQSLEGTVNKIAPTPQATGVSWTPTVTSPNSTFVSDNSQVANGATYNFGGVAINIESSGNSNIDAKQLYTALEREARIRSGGRTTLGSIVNA